MAIEYEQVLLLRSSIYSVLASSRGLFVHSLDLSPDLCLDVKSVRCAMILEVKEPLRMDDQVLVKIKEILHA